MKAIKMWLKWHLVFYPVCSPFQIHSTESSPWPEGHRWPGDRLLSIAPCCSTGQLGLWQLPNLLSGSASADSWFTAAAQREAQVRVKWLTACVFFHCQCVCCVCGWAQVLPVVRESGWIGVWPQNFLLILSRAVMVPLWEKKISGQKCLLLT